MADYSQRIVDAELDELFTQLPALLLDGAKHVGKTSTALQRVTTVRRLDEPGQRALAEASPDEAVRGTGAVLLDEWQRVPEVWDAVKRRVDADPRAGQLLLTGSAPPGNVRIHSGAGRIHTVRMRPRTLPERGATEPTVSLARLLTEGGSAVTGSTGWGLGNYVDAILDSGFPGLGSLQGRALRSWQDGYLERIVERDLEEAGLAVRRPATVRAWMRAYAAATATATSWEKIRDAASAGADNKPAKTTSLTYVEALGSLRILEEQEAWIPGTNHLKRLTMGPKHHLVDPALAARLVGVGRDDLLAGKAGAVELPREGTFLGALFESLAVLSLRVFAQAAESRVSHLRVEDGRHEIDAIVEGPDGRVLAVEVKLAATVNDRDVRHLNWLREQLGDRVVDVLVVSAGPHAYRRRDGVAVVPLALLGV